MAGSSCVTWTGYTDDNQLLVYSNSCNVPMQFTLQWATGEQTFRIGANQTRTVPFIDQASIISEAPAAFGLGPAGQVSIEQDSTGVQGVDELFVYNEHDVYTLVHVVLWLFPGPGPGLHNDIDLTIVVPPQQHVLIYDLLVGQITYQVNTLIAEDDPPPIQAGSQSRIETDEFPCTICDCPDFIYNANNDVVCDRQTCGHGASDHGID